MSNDAALRPIERRIRQLVDDGVDDVEIAWRFRRSPRYVRQVMQLAELPRTGESTPARGPDELRPLERRVLWWRSQGVDHDDLAPRFRRSPGFLRQVEQLAQYKLRKA